MILVLVGDGPYLPELKKKVEELKLAKNVIFTGMIIPEEVGHYYQAGDLFVSASTSETQGMQKRLQVVFRSFAEETDVWNKL